MLRRVGASPALRVASAVHDVLEQAVERGTISPMQRQALARDMATRLEPLGIA